MGRVSDSQPLDQYTEARQCVYKTDDKELSELYPLDLPSPPIIAINPDEPDERPPKRPRMDMSEQTGTLPGTTSGASNASLQERKSNRNTIKRHDYPFRSQYLKKI